MILWRALPWEPGARPSEPGGPLFFPRPFQGVSRHDNPSRYGCMYTSEAPASAVAELLAAFRGATLDDAMLDLERRRLALARLELADAAELIDLDEPRTLTRERLRPSQVATRHRATTQEYAVRIFARHEAAAGLRWWSTLESSWINVTLFDRAASALTAPEVRPLTREEPALAEAAELLGLA